MRSMRPFYSRLLLLSSVAASSALNAAAIDPQLDLLTEQMRLLDKAEQHIHLGGAWPLSYLKEVATTEEFAALTAMIDQISESVDYHAVFRAFGLTSKIMNSDERIENGVAALCEELVRDNVTYVELRTGLKNLGSGFEGYLQAVLRGMEKGVAGSSLKAGLVLSLRRDTSPSDCRKTIDLALAYFGKGVVGIDVSGDSTVGDVTTLFPPLLHAKSQGLPITLHIGESNKESAELQMLELTTIQPQRIGHGVHLCKEAAEWIKSNQILLEMCLTSAIKTQMVREAGEHPGLKLLLEGHPVSICTDDPLIFNTTLSQEYALVGHLTGLTPEELAESQKETARYHFLR